MHQKSITFLYAISVIVPITFAIRASNNMLATTVPLLVKYYFNFNSAEVGLLSALSSLGSLIASGLLNSRLNAVTRRRAFIGSSLAYAVILPTYYLAGPVTIWALSALSGLSLGLIMPNIITAAGLVNDKKSRERILAIYTTALSLSLILGPLIETAMLSTVTIPWVFLLFAPFGIIAAILSFLLKFPDERKTPVKVRVYHNPGFRVAIYNNTAYSIPFAFIVVFAGIYAKTQFNVSFAVATGLYSLFYTTSFISRLFLSIRPVEKIRTITAFSILLTALGLLMATLTKNLMLFMASLLILGVPHGLTYPVSLISISRSFKSEERNVANSQFYAFMTMVTIAVMPLTGLLAQAVGLKNVFALLVPFVLFLFVLMRRDITSMEKITAEVS
ncbi:MAG: MFS transporter [Thaumarchaeota archaeon]|jgi:MFS family permease|nr:MFS transporter [Nitrososphaerota archaeon]